MNESEKIKYNQGFVDGYKKATKQANAVIEDIKAEIQRIEISGQIDEHTLFVRTADQVKNKVLEIIDKHTGK